MSWPPDLKTELGGEENPLVRCACGRTVNADMMRDTRPVKDRLSIEDDHRCDSCMEKFYRAEQISHSDFCRAHDAPLEVLERVERREQVLRDEKEAALEQQRAERGPVDPVDKGAV